MNPLFERKFIKIKMDSLLDKFNAEKIKKELIDCMKDEGILEDKIYEEEPDYFSEINDIRCDLCKIKDIREIMGDITCNLCGTVLQKNFSHYKKYEPIVYSPVDEKIELIINGKKINKELLSYYPENKLSSSERMYLNGYRKIRDILDTVNVNFDKQELKAISNIYWNIVKFYEVNPGIKPSLKQAISKKGFIILSIFYGLNIKNGSILYDTIAYVNVPFDTVSNLNNILFIIFKNTEVYERLNYNIFNHADEVNNDNIPSGESVEIMNELVENKIFQQRSQELNDACDIYLMMKKNQGIRLSDAKKKLGITSNYRLNKHLGQIVNYFSNF